MKTGFSISHGRQQIWSTTRWITFHGADEAIFVKIEGRTITHMTIFQKSGAMEIKPWGLNPVGPPWRKQLRQWRSWYLARKFAGLP